MDTEHAFTVGTGQSVKIHFGGNAESGLPLLVLVAESGYRLSIDLTPDICRSMLGPLLWCFERVHGLSRSDMIVIIAKALGATVGQAVPPGAPAPPQEPARVELVVKTEPTPPMQLDVMVGGVPHRTTVTQRGQDGRIEVTETRPI